MHAVYKMENRLDLKSIEIMQTLGIGAFGRVRLAKFKGTEDYIALKILKKQEILRLKHVDHVISEYTILQQLDHPYIVHLRGHAQDTRFLFFALEFVQGGELFNYLKRVGKLDSLHARYYAAQIALVFEYLHSSNIIYRDLKPENILIASDGYLKLTDFGFAKVLKGRTFTLCGTPEYLAPEIILNKGYGKPVDWWTFGILIYEMLVGNDPFFDEEPLNIYKNILSGKIKFPKNIDKKAKSLIKHLLVADLSKRYGNLKNAVNDIKGHRWFLGMDWVGLLQKRCQMPYIPVLRSSSDTANFPTYPDSDILPPSIRDIDDPFVDW